MMLVNYILSIIFGIYFWFFLIVFHPIQWIAYHVFGINAHRTSVEILNFFLVRGLHIVGTRISVNQKGDIQKNVPLIIIANHQSMYDIVGLIWFMRKYNPVFVSKKELAKGIPSISFNLRKSNAALIDRKDRHQAIQAISNLGKYIESNKYAAVIFPEGTRSRKGLRKFSTGGIETLVKNAPSAHILPIAIDGTGRVDAFNVYPIRSFQKISWTTLHSFDPSGMDINEIVTKARNAINAELKDT